MNVGFLHTGLSFLSNIDCGNPALWRGRRCNACGMPGFIARQQRKQAIQPDTDEEPTWNAEPHLFPDSGARQFPPRNLLLIAREADLLGPLGDRIADPLLQLPAHLQSRQVKRARQQQPGMNPAADAGQPAVIGERGPQEFRDRRPIGPVEKPGGPADAVAEQRVELIHKKYDA